MRWHYNNEDSTPYKELAVKVKESFRNRFFCNETGCLYDVLDVNDTEINAIIYESGYR